MQEGLRDKVLVITGTGSGIGRAAASQAIEAGAKVVAVDRNPPAGSGDSAEILRLQADVTEPAAPDEIVERTIRRFGRLDGLINNAGIYPRDDLVSLTRPEFDRLIDINLRAPLFLAQAAIAAMRRTGTHGSVVNVGSINAHVGQPDLLTYSITKGGLTTMTRNLANALAGEGIRINQVNVGWTLTEGEIGMQESLGAAADWHRHLDPRAAPRGRLLEPDEVARHILFWASDASRPANGTVYEMEQYPVVGRL